MTKKVEKNSSKKEYSTPKVKKYGLIKNLTAAGSSGTTEMNVMQTNRRP